MSKRFFWFPLLGALLFVMACNEAEGPDKYKAMIEDKGMPFTQASFISICNKKDLATAELFVKAGIDVNAVDPNGNSALVIAANKNNADVVRFLMENGANPDVKGSKGLIPLDDAASLGNLESVKELIRYAPGQKSEDIFKATNAYLLAARYGHTEMVKVLLDAGADVNWVSPEGWNALTWAAREGRYDVAELVINAGIDVNRADKEGYTPLRWAVDGSGYQRLAQIIRKNGGKMK
jgi:ankyrin repeat protein